MSRTEWDKAWGGRIRRGGAEDFVIRGGGGVWMVFLPCLLVFSLLQVTCVISKTTPWDLVLRSAGHSSWQGVLTGMVAAALEPELK
jgi:hypothetical protein